MMQRKTILVAPLNWGLGHATRCIPIINELIIHGFKVLIASDGPALLLLQKEFPTLESIELPSYDISYAKKGAHLKWKLFLKIPHILKTISREKKVISTLIAERSIQGIISDNRWGVRNKTIPSVFITHQINVLSGNTSKLTGKLQQKYINKFTTCWIPDLPGIKSLSGKLSHTDALKFNTHYIGPLSRMTKMKVKKKYDIIIILSGPEPQRTLLENKLLSEFKNDDRKTLLVRGVIEENEKTVHFDNITIVNFLTTDALSKAINASDLVIARSGYTTIMDLSILEKRAFFIPTPGQYEQIYLANRLDQLGVTPHCEQEDFSVKSLSKITSYSGLKNIQTDLDFGKLFSLFHSK